MKQNVKKELKCIIITFLSAIISIVALHTFIVPSKFSPSGIDGVSTILYELTGINIGWFKIIINVPLLILAWIFLNKRFVIYVMLFTLLDSVGVILLESVNFYVFIPANLTTEIAIGYRLIAAIFSGVMMGVCIGLMLKIGFSSGGVDIIACLFHKIKPHFHVEKIISFCSYTIVAMSYFIYGDLTSILLSVVQIFVSEWTITAILRKDRYAIEVKIVTKKPDAIKNEILYKYHHSATILESQGMYTGDKYFMVITVMNRWDVPEFMTLLKKYPETFVYFSDGVRVQGDFHYTKIDNGERTNAY